MYPQPPPGGALAQSILPGVGRVNVGLILLDVQNTEIIVLLLQVRQYAAVVLRKKLVKVWRSLSNEDRKG